MTKASDKKAIDFYQLLKKKNYNEVIEAILEDPEPRLFKCIKSAINMIGEEAWKNSHLFCLVMIGDLIESYGVPAITPLNTEYGAFALEKGLEISRDRVEEIAILSLEKCSFSQSRDCIPFIANFYKELFRDKFEKNNFPFSEEDQHNQFGPFYLEIEKLSSNLDEHSKKKLEDELKKFEDEYNIIREELLDEEHKFIKLEFQIIRDHIEYLETAQNQPEEDLSNSDATVEKSKLSMNVESFEPAQNTSDEKNNFNLNNDEMEEINFSNPLEETQVSEKPNATQAEASGQLNLDEKVVSTLPALEIKPGLEEVDAFDRGQAELEDEFSRQHNSGKKIVNSPLRISATKNESRETKNIIKLDNKSTAHLKESFFGPQTLEKLAVSIFGEPKFHHEEKFYTENPSVKPVESSDQYSLNLEEVCAQSYRRSLTSPNHSSSSRR